MVSFANILSERNGLTCSEIHGKNRRHARAFPTGVSIRPIAPQRTSGGCHGERSAANANRSVSTKTEAPVADKLGPGILDHSPQPAVRLATSPDLRPGRYCRPLAARTLPQILGQVVQAAAPAPRSPPHRRRTPPIDRANGRRQSALARAQDSRRTQNARHRDLRAHCFPYPAQTPSPAESDLEDLPAQPCRSHRVDRFLYSADHHDEGVVRIRCPGT